MKSKLNKGQIQLIQVAVRAAGIRGEFGDKRYRMVLAQYTKPSGGPCTSSKDLGPEQMEDLLALCESMGFRMLGKSATCCRDKVAMRAIDGHRASCGQQAAIRHLAGDLGWDDRQLRGMIERMTGRRCQSELTLSRQDAWQLTEAMKAMLLRQTGIKGSNLKQIQTSMEAKNDGKETG
jgi:hypothetical protein